MAASVIRVIQRGSELGRSLPSIPVIVQYQGPTAYVTGGDALAPSVIGLSEIHFVDITGGGGYVCEYDYTAGKIKFYRQTAATGALAEVSAAVDVSAPIFRMLIYGK